MVELLIRGGFCSPTSLDRGLVCRDPLRAASARGSVRILRGLALSKALLSSDFRGPKTTGHQ